ncbi:MAG: hypothetical protein SVU69_11845 [Pseudomonadota bacterium]|nr:hypothetical protein [Pseudomonadota bacterium]
MAECLLELKLSEIRLAKPETRQLARGKEDVNVLEFTLHYASAGKPTLKTIKTLKWDAPLPTTADTDLGYEKRVLFKERVQGETALSVEIASIDNPSAAEQFFTGLSANVFKTAFGLATKGIGNVVLGAVNDYMGESIFDAMASKAVVRKIGRAQIPIDVAQLDTVGTLTQSLTAPETLKVDKTGRIANDGEGDEVVVQTAGDPAGTIVIAYRKL